MISRKQSRLTWHCHRAESPPPHSVRCAKTGAAVVVESSALAFKALASLPGPYVGAFVGKLGAEGLPALLAGFEDKTAVAEHAVAFSAGPGAEPKVTSDVLVTKSWPRLCYGACSVFAFPGRKELSTQKASARSFDFAFIFVLALPGGSSKSRHPRCAGHPPLVLAGRGRESKVTRVTHA